MQRYSKVFSAFWGDNKIKQLSDDSKLLFLYLMSCKHCNMIGFYEMPLAYAAADLKWSEDKVKKVLKSLDCLVAYDQQNEIVLIKNYLRWNEIQGDNQAKGAVRAAGEMKSPLVEDFLVAIAMHAQNYLSRFEAGLDLVCRGFEGGSEHQPESGTGTGTGTGTETGTETGEVVLAPVPYDEIVGLYNQMCIGLPRVQKLSDKRRRILAVRWQEVKDIDFFIGLFQRVANTPFLAGDNDRQWRADFEWLLNENNITKVFEGKYDRVGVGRQAGNLAGVNAFLGGEAYGEEGSGRNIFANDGQL